MSSFKMQKRCSENIILYSGNFSQLFKFKIHNLRLTGLMVEGGGNQMRHSDLSALLDLVNSDFNLSKLASQLLFLHCLDLTI